MLVRLARLLAHALQHRNPKSICPLAPLFALRIATMSSVQLREADLFDCCACRQWASVLAGKGPYADTDALLQLAREIWWGQASPCLPECDCLLRSC